MTTLVRLSLQFRFLVLAAAAALVVLGVYRLPSAPVDALPEFAPPIIEVQTEAPGLSAPEVEELITLNLEELLTSTSWLKTLRSKSIQGLSSILLVFEPGTDLMRARQLVQERLSMAYALPNVSKPPVMLQPLSTTSRAMIVGLSSKDVSLIDMSVIARWTISPKLLGVPGVANVAIWGQRARELQVQYDPDHLRTMGVTLNQIVEATGDSLWVSPLSFLEASTPGTGGWIDTPNQRLAIQHVQPIVSPNELAQVAVGKAALRLGDVAKVVEEHPPLIGDAIVNGGPGLLLVIEKFKDANSVDVVEGVDAALDNLTPGLPGIDIDTSVFRSTTFITSALANLRTVLIAGSVLVALALAGWFAAWRSVMISIAAIVASLVVAALVFEVGNFSLDLLALSGLAIALVAIIDDAVIDAEGITRGLKAYREGEGPRSTASAIVETCLQTRRPIIFATLVIMLALAPLLMLEGSAGAFVRPLVIACIVALLASTVVAVLLTPALAFLVEPRTRRQSGTHNGWLQARYDAALSRVLRAPAAGLAVAGLLILAGLVVMPLIGWSLLPTFRENDVRIAWQAHPGTSLPEMQRIMTAASKELRSVQGVRSVVGEIGRAITGDQIVGVESGEFWVSIDPAADYDATLASVRHVIDKYPGLHGSVETYLTDKVKEVLSDGGKPIVVRLEGPERDELRSEAQRVASSLSGIAGLANLRVEGQVTSPHVEVRVDLSKAGGAGLTPGDIRRAAATLFGGLEVGNLYDEQKVFPVVVWGAPEVRQNLSNIRDMLVDAPGGRHVRLGDVADVRVAASPTVIEREGVTERVDITADVVGRSVGAVAGDVQAQLRELQFPLEFHAYLVSDYGDQQSAHLRVLTAIIAAAIGIYFLLQACFQSWRLALFFYASLFAALSGGVLTTFLFSGSVLFGSLAGLLAVFGLAARNGILLIGTCQRLRRTGGTDVHHAQLLTGAKERLRAIAISTTAIACTFLPAVVLGNVAGLEILHPMAITILGGLVTSTLVTLFVVPALYLAAASQIETQVLGDEQYA